MSTHPITTGRTPTRPDDLNNVTSGECCAPNCDRPPEPDAPFPICRRHMAQVLRYFDGHAARLIRGGE